MIYKKGAVWKVRGNPTRFDTKEEAEASLAACSCEDWNCDPCECAAEEVQDVLELSPLERMRSTWKSADET